MCMGISRHLCSVEATLFAECLLVPRCCTLFHLLQRKTGLPYIPPDRRLFSTWLMSAKNTR